MREGNRGGGLLGCEKVEAWKPSMALLNSGVIQAIKQQEAEELKKEARGKGIPYDRVPAKAVFTRKAATGGGNAMELLAGTSRRKGGIDASQVRAMVAAGAQRSCEVGQSPGWT